MKKSLALIFVLVAIVLGILYFQRTADIFIDYRGEKVRLGAVETGMPISVGKFAPDFILTDYENNLVESDDFMNRKVIINFWATWCPFCIDEMPLFEEHYESIKERGGDLVAINRGESKEQAKKFTDKMNLSYHLLLNESDDVYMAHQGLGMPLTIFINEEGRIEQIKRGPFTDEEFEMTLNDFLGEEKAASSSEPSPKAEASPTPNSKNDVKATPKPVAKSTPKPSPKTVAKKEESRRPVKVTNGIKHSVPLESILGGGPPKDGIPSIDDPKFVSVEEADEYLDDMGIGVAYSNGGVNRFYPNQITVWHEIVNDKVAGQPALITYCPLCGTGIVFEPIVEGEAVEFGTSGKLWNSNLVMYDRKTDTYWSQVLGEAILGKLTGEKLKKLPHDNMLWEDWKAAYPDGEVLSRETGAFRDYTRSPYGDYDTNSRVMFPVDKEDDRFHPKEPTWGIVINDVPKAYTVEALGKRGTREFTDKVGGVSLKIKYNPQVDTIEIYRLDTGEEVVPTFGFWFSWIAAWPDSAVY